MLGESMCELNALVVALTETHFNEHMLDAECSFSGYDIYRADRAYGRAKGGVALYIKDTIAASCKLLASNTQPLPS